MKIFKQKTIIHFVFYLAAFCATSHSFALEINQITPQQISKNTTIDITPTLDAGTAKWFKIIGPDWVDVNSSTGKITGTAPHVGGAHYVQIRAASGGKVDITTFILIVGSQTVYTMDGAGANPSTITEAYGLMSGGDVLIVPDGTYSGPDNTINGNLSRNVKMVQLMIIQQ